MKNVSAKTLYAILNSAGISSTVTESCVSGRLPRTFGGCSDATFAWKIRDASLWLAEESVSGTQEITLVKILFRIMPELTMGESALSELAATAQQVLFYKFSYKHYCWQSPAAGYVSYLTPRELFTALQLYYIFTIWQNSPSFLEADFSSAVPSFDNKIVAEILAVIEPTSRKPTIIEKQLLEFLSEAPRLRKEIESHMALSRSNLLTNYLYPARNMGWITTTDTTTPSSPSQRYMLTEAGKQAITNS